MPKEFITIGYTYDELSEEAREKVKQWYLDDPWRNDFFSRIEKNRIRV